MNLNKLDYNNNALRRLKIIYRRNENTQQGHKSQEELPGVKTF